MPHSPIDPALSDWRASYLASLRAPRGWWSVVGLAWFGPEPVDLGSAHPQLGLSAALPERFARLQRSATGALIEPLSDLPLWLGGEPLGRGAASVQDGDTLALGPDDSAPMLAFLQRGERFGVRVFDPAAGRARGPEGVAWFDPEPAWRCEAAFIAAAEGETLPIVNLLGDVSEAPVAGRLRIEHAAGATELIARPKPDGLMLHFRDATSGRSERGTYGAGRFLHVDPPVAGRAIVDFNRAFQPPCAHTPFATCPMPPLENRLPLAVEAGERTAAAHPPG